MNIYISFIKSEHPGLCRRSTDVGEVGNVAI